MGKEINTTLFQFIENLKVISSGDVTYFDKLEPKKNYEDLKIRVVPPELWR